MFGFIQSESREMEFQMNEIPFSFVTRREIILHIFVIFLKLMIGMQDDNIANPPKKVKPDAGLEPATVGLKVQRSTDWANQALQNCRR